MELGELIKSINSPNVQKTEEALLEVRKRSKNNVDVEAFFQLDLQTPLFDLLERNNGKYQVVVLSIVANCASINEKWRQIVSFLFEEVQLYY
jgi:hypothetical protein